MDTKVKTVDERILEAAEAEGWTAGDAASDYLASGDVYGLDVLEQVWEQTEQLDLPVEIKDKLALVLSEQNIADLLGFDFVESAIEHLESDEATARLNAELVDEYQAYLAEQEAEAMQTMLANIAANYVIVDVKPLKNSNE